MSKFIRPAARCLALASGAGMKSETASQSHAGRRGIAGFWSLS